jgi:hypothetical protein
MAANRALLGKGLRVRPAHGPGALCRPWPDYARCGAVCHAGRQPRWRGQQGRGEVWITNDAKAREKHERLSASGVTCGQAVMAAEMGRCDLRWLVHEAWAARQPSALFAHFRVYRDPNPFAGAPCGAVLQSPTPIRPGANSLLWSPLV